MSRYTPGSSSEGGLFTLFIFLGMMLCILGPVLYLVNR